jgi:hypothetical protein
MEVHELAKKIDEFQREVRDDMAVLKRGMYGDPVNKVRGLLERQDSDEERIDKIEKRQWKVGAMMGGGIVAIDIIIFYIKEFAK